MIVGDMLGASTMETYANTALHPGRRGEQAANHGRAYQPTSTGQGNRGTPCQRHRGASGHRAGIGYSWRRADRADCTKPVPYAYRVSGSMCCAAGVAPWRSKLSPHQENTRLLIGSARNCARWNSKPAARSEILELSDRVEDPRRSCSLLEEAPAKAPARGGAASERGQVAEELSALDYETLSGALQRGQSLDRDLQQQQLREAEINRQLAVLVLTQMQNAPAVSYTAILLCGVFLIVASAGIAAFSHVYPLNGAFPDLRWSCSASVHVKAYRAIAHGSIPTNLPAAPIGSRRHSTSSAACWRTTVCRASRNWRLSCGSCVPPVSNGQPVSSVSP